MLLLDVSRLIWRRWAGRLPTGIDRVCLAYVEHYADEALAVVQRGAMRWVLDKERSQALFTLLIEPGTNFRLSLSKLVAKTAHLSLLSHRSQGSLYLNVGHTGLDSPDLTSWIAEQKLRAVYFVHDLIPITHPEYCRPGEEERHRVRMNTVLKSAAGIIGNSVDTLEAMAAFADRRGDQLPAMVAAPLGCDLPDRMPAKTVSNVHPANFVVVGTIEGRKNHLLLLQIWARLANELGAEAPHLTIIGQRGWESEQAADLLDRARSLRGHVTELGRCSDAELMRQLQSARALLFPTFVEGYGLPLAEALHAGTPVIASDLPVFREICGDVPDYLDPLDGVAWRELILRYAKDPSPERDAQLARMEGYRAPTWSDHFAIVDRLIASL